MRFVLVWRFTVAGAAVVALTACGGASKDSPSNDTQDASFPSPDASFPLDGRAPTPEAGTGDALDGSTPNDASTACGPGAVAALPSPYTIQAQSFPVDDHGFTLELNAVLPGNTYSLFLAEFDLPGGSYHSLLTLAAGDTLGETILTDATNAYFFDSGGSAGGTVGLYSLARAGGSPAVPLVAIGPSDYLGFELGPNDIWFQLHDASAGAASIYSVPKSGGPLGSPAYTTAPGLFVEGVFVDASTIYWAERSFADTYQDATTTIYSSPTAAVLSPTPLATFSAEGEVETIASDGVVYFTVETIVPHPTPQMFPFDGDAASGGNDAESPEDAASSLPVLNAGLYSIGGGGAVTSIDSNGEPPLFAGNDGIFYVSNNGIATFDAPGATTRSYMIDSWLAFSVADETTVFYADQTGCIYQAVAPPK